MEPQIGDRVGVVNHSDEKTVYFLGYGTYLGPEVPPGNINPPLNAGWPNPKIRLDNGKVVWGCECWWGSEEQIKTEIEEFDHIVDVDIDDMRNGEFSGPGIDDIDGVEIKDIKDIPDEIKEKLELLRQNPDAISDSPENFDGMDYIDISPHEGESMDQMWARAIKVLKEKHPDAKIVIPEEVANKMKGKKEEQIDPNMN